MADEKHLPMDDNLAPSPLVEADEGKIGLPSHPAQHVHPANSQPIQPIQPVQTSQASTPVDGHLNQNPVVLAAAPTSAPQGQASISSPAVDNVLQSEIGVNTLLNRLKQSIASARDFATFLKKRSILEEEQSQGLKKLCRVTHDNIRRPDNRQGSYAQQFDEVNRIHERMAENGMQFALALHQMNEELIEMTMTVERGRKHWKQSGLSAEKRVSDSELLMDKAKAKYESLAEDYDRARTGGQSGKKFGLKGPKTAAQYEEDLHRKLQAADSEYGSKVQTAQGQRQELQTLLRPQAVRALQDLILECDSALTMQLQKFATANERLLLNNGLSVSPLNGQVNGQGPQPKSLREVVHQIDNERDLQHYVAAFSSKVPPRNSDIKYERHAALSSQQQTPPALARQSQSQTQISSPMQQQQPAPNFPAHGRQGSGVSPHPPQPHEQAQSPGGQQLADSGYGTRANTLQSSTMTSHSPSQMPSQQYSQAPQIPPQFPPSMPQQGTPSPRNGSPFTSELPPLKPVFGVSLDDLFKRDGSAVPIIVYQCIQAIDLFGLEVHGIYRNSGSTSQIARIKAMVDHDASSVDFRNPEGFSHDVNNVVGVMKLFFRDLPVPLFTRDPDRLFMKAAAIEEYTARRDRLHELINDLPDPNYATLRALTLHLYRVQEHSDVNQMNNSNLSKILAPTFLGSDSDLGVADADWQKIVLNTILENTLQIFDDD